MQNQRYTEQLTAHALSALNRLADHHERNKDPRAYEARQAMGLILTGKETPVTVTEPPKRVPPVDETLLPSWPCEWCTGNGCPKCSGKGYLFTPPTGKSPSEVSEPKTPWYIRLPEKWYKFLDWAFS